MQKFINFSQCLPSVHITWHIVKLGQNISHDLFNLKLIKFWVYIYIKVIQKVKMTLDNNFGSVLCRLDIWPISSPTSYMTLMLKNLIMVKIWENFNFWVLQILHMDLMLFDNSIKVSKFQSNQINSFWVINASMAYIVEYLLYNMEK